jgi:hypothetical protein
VPVFTRQVPGKVNEVADEEYGVQYTIKVALPQVGKDTVIAGLVEAGFTKKEAEALVRSVEQEEK